MSTELSEVALYGDQPSEARREAFLSGEIPVAVYGLGKMGLPLAGVYADVTGNVIGADVDPEVAEAVDAGVCHVEGEPGLPELVQRTASAGELSATADPVEAAERARHHVIIVPTLLTDENEPDLSMLEAAVRSVGEGLSAGDMVVIESTVPPGTTADVVEPILARESGLDPGEFGLAFCPERTSSGRALQDIRGAYPKVVGGVDEGSTEAAELVYDEITSNDVVPVSDARTAEAVKVFEGLYRDVNIALSNELATVADDLEIDVTEAIDVANTQPFCDIHTPGPGVGGHCIPVYPYFVTKQVEGDTDLLETARAVNDGMPGFVADKVESLLAEEDRDVAGADVLLLGATYRAGVAETRKAPARAIARDLDERGASVDVVDPMLDRGDLAEDPVTMRDRRDVADRSYDAVVYVTDHEEFADLDWSGVGDAAVVDCRQVVSPDGDRPVYTVGVGRDA